MKRFVAVLAACAFLASPAIAAPPSWASGVYSGHVTRGALSFATFDAGSKATLTNLTNTNKTATQSGSGSAGARTTCSLSAKIHAEFTVTGQFSIYVANGSWNPNVAQGNPDVTSFGPYAGDGQIRYQTNPKNTGYTGVNTTTFGAWATTNIVAVEIDVPNTLMSVNVYNGSTATGWTTYNYGPSGPTSGGMALTPSSPIYLGISTFISGQGATLNSGASSFTITPQSGYVGLQC